MEIAVASGKGGTGKTFITSNLAILFDREEGGAVAVDADVEAPDLALALGGERRVLWKREIWESAKASIDYNLCDGCGKCFEVCAFDAIIFEKGSKPTIIREFCEGCTACMKVCPRNAIMIEKTRTGQLSAVETLYGINVVTGDLEVGGRNSGEIVFTAREEAKKLAEKIGKRTILIDCAPGIGCPVVSSLSGADLLLLVVEPIPQSLQGAKRILKLAESFRLKTYCILNKYDLNEEYSEKIPEELGLEMIGKIPYDESVVESYTMMRPIVVDSGENPVKTSLINLFENLTEELSK